MTESLDIDCTMNLLAKQAVEIAQKTGTLLLSVYVSVVVSLCLSVR